MTFNKISRKFVLYVEELLTPRTLDYYLTPRKVSPSRWYILLPDRSSVLSWPQKPNTSEPRVSSSLSARPRVARLLSPWRSSLLREPSLLWLMLSTTRSWLSLKESVFI